MSRYVPGSEGELWQRWTRSAERCIGSPFCRSWSSLVDGTTYLVKHPDFVALTHRRELIFVSDDDGLHELDLALVGEIETPGGAAQPAAAE